MKYLFEENALKLLESFCFTKTLFAFDFDGTLAPIVLQPSQAKMRKKTRVLFEQLISTTQVAIISGRSLKDLSLVLDSHPPFLIGNHGLEGIKKKKHSLQNAKKITQDWVAAIEKKIKKLPGTSIENKEYSLALHYRKSRKRAEAKTELMILCAELNPSPTMLLGKCVINLIPQGSPHKGMALLDLMKECNVKAAFYIGDDDTDEDIFSLPETRLFSVRVGKKESSAAQYFLKQQSQIDKLLKIVISYTKNGN